MTGPLLDTKARRALGRMLSRAASDSAEDSLRQAEGPVLVPPRIGITGPPGVGKSTLIGRLAERRLNECESLAVLAIDPTSPLTRGSVLGDRIRMEALAAKPGVFIRSVPSRGAVDGLCDNVENMLRVLEDQGFGEIFLETVGAGQSQTAIATVVDTVVMVLSPDAGDVVQVMKAGLMEMADIYVVNKADLPNAHRMVSEIHGSIIGRHRKKDAWRPVVVLTSSRKEDGLADLDRAITSHVDWARKSRDALKVCRRRKRHHVQRVLERRLARLLEEVNPTLWDRPASDVYQALAGRLTNLIEPEITVHADRRSGTEEGGGLVSRPPAARS